MEFPTRRVTWRFAGGYLLVLSYLTLTPDPYWFLGAPGKQAELVIDRTLSDLVQHGLAYAVLSVLFVAASWDNRRQASICAAVVVAHAVATEWLQTFIPLRMCGWIDALANLVGAGLGWMAAWLIARFFCAPTAHPRLVSTATDSLSDRS